MIYLEDFERNYLLHVLTKSPYTGEKPASVAKKLIIAKINSDIERLNGIKECEHEYATYTGIKSCCSKCGTYDIGNGITWELLPTGV
jgi:hypothetical protein